MEVNKEINPTIWRKVEKTKSKFVEFIKEVDVKCFDFNILHDFKFMKSVVKIAMDVWWNKRRKENEYKKKDSLERWIYPVMNLFKPNLIKAELTGKLLIQKTSDFKVFDE